MTYEKMSEVQSLQGTVASLTETVTETQRGLNLAANLYRLSDRNLTAVIKCRSAEYFINFEYQEFFL